MNLKEAKFRTINLCGSAVRATNRAACQQCGKSCQKIDWKKHRAECQSVPDGGQEFLKRAKRWIKLKRPECMKIATNLKRSVLYVREIDRQVPRGNAHVFNDHFVRAIIEGSMSPSELKSVPDWVDMDLEKWTRIFGLMESDEMSRSSGADGVSCVVVAYHCEVGHFVQRLMFFPKDFLAE